MRGSGPGQLGLLLMAIGLAITASMIWSGCTDERRAPLGESLPSLFIGLSLLAFGWSLFSRARRARRREEE